MLLALCSFVSFWDDLGKAVHCKMDEFPESFRTAFDTSHLLLILPGWLTEDMLPNFVTLSFPQTMEAFQNVTQCCYSFLSNNNGNNELIMGRFRLLLPSSLCLLIHVLIAYNGKRLLIMWRFRLLLPSAPYIFASGMAPPTPLHWRLDLKPVLSA